MARPTTDRKGCKIELRINADTRELLEKRSHGRGMSEYVRGILDEALHGNERKELTDKVTNGNYVTDKSNGVIRPELTEMINISGGSVDVFMDELCGLVESGEIRLMNGHIAEAYIGLDMEKFFEACDASGKDPQGVLDAVAANIWRM